jgi:hypothetical protein
MNRKIIGISLLILFGFQGLCYAESKLISVKVEKAPIIGSK